MGTTLFKITEWISRLARLNLLWIGFTLLGLVIFGFFPATVAMFVVVRQWLRGKTDLPISDSFRQAYRQEFVKANGIGLIIGVIGAVLYLNVIFLDLNNSPNIFLVSVPVYLFILFASLTLLYLFPVYAHYNLGNFNLVKQAILIMIIHPFQSLMMVIGIAASVVTMYYIPALLFFFGGSFIALLLMATCYPIFIKIEKQQPA